MVVRSRKLSKVKHTEMAGKKKKTLIVILGPTAVGKTRLAIEIARAFHTEIISSDSRQFYRELKIGVASPSEQELAEVTHHFIGHLSVSDYYNVSMFENDVLEKLKGLFTTNDHVVMVGGSGLYIDAVCNGIDELPDVDETLRENLKTAYRTHGIEYLREKLRDLDPEYYDVVDLLNPKRLLSAIEVCISTGKTSTSLRKNKPEKRDFDIIKIGLNTGRDELFDNIHARVERMIGDGLVEEARALLPFREVNALNTVGYKELFNYFDGEMGLDEAIAKIKTNTRRYAKRQLTWFKKDDEITWFPPDETQRIIDFLGDF